MRQCRIFDVYDSLSLPVPFLLAVLSTSVIVPTLLDPWPKRSSRSHWQWLWLALGDLYIAPPRDHGPYRGIPTEQQAHEVGMTQRSFDLGLTMACTEAQIMQWVICVIESGVHWGFSSNGFTEIRPFAAEVLCCGCAKPTCILCVHTSTKESCRLEVGWYGHIMAYWSAPNKLFWRWCRRTTFCGHTCMHTDIHVPRGYMTQRTCVRMLCSSTERKAWVGTLNLVRMRLF